MWMRKDVRVSAREERERCEREWKRKIGEDRRSEEKKRDE
jgi:hypothetical protein